MKAAGYGMSELEVLIRTVTTILNAEKFNAGQLTQGGTQKGVLVIKTDGAESRQVESFKRDFREALRNASSFWRPPVLHVSKESDIDWLTLDRSNRDMEYAQLFDFLVKQACGVYQIAPEEINWSIGAAGASMQFESRSHDKIVTSQKRGLRPLLNFFASMLNVCVLNRVAEGF